MGCHMKAEQHEVEGERKKGKRGTRGGRRVLAEDVRMTPSITEVNRIGGLAEV